MGLKYQTHKQEYCGANAGSARWLTASPQGVLFAVTGKRVYRRLALRQPTHNEVNHSLLTHPVNTY